MKSNASTTESKPNWRLGKDAWGRLTARGPVGLEEIGVIPIRLFPLSDPEKWIALLDHAGRELVVIDDPRNLDGPSLQLLEEELTRREFVPVIERIVWVSGNSEPCSWEVETNRGRTEFVLKSDDDIRRLGPASVLIVDSHGIRYLIPNRHNLDPYSRRVIEWYV